MKINKDSTAILLAITLVFSFFIIYKNVFLNGEVIVPGDIPYNTPVWQGEAPDQKYYKAANYILSDQINQFYIWHHLAHISMSTSGVIPLWNPHIFAGQPLVANAQSALFYPPNLLLFLFGPGVVATVRAFFNLSVILIFSYLAGRQFGISRAGSILISAGMGLCGPVTVWLGHPHANVFSWFPFLIWSGEKIFRSEKKSVWTGLFGTGAGIAMLGGHPETAFHLLLTVFMFFFFRMLYRLRERSSPFRSSLMICTGLLIGILVGSVQLVPFGDFLFRSATLHQGGRGEHDGPIFWSGAAAGNLAELTTLIYPDFFGNPPDRTFRSPNEDTSNYNEQAVYFGLIPFSFFIFIIFRRRSEPVIKILTVISVFSLGVAWRLPFFEIFNHLPVFSIVANGRLKFFFVFTAILLAGYGFDHFMRKIKTGIPDTGTLLRFAGVPVAAILVFVLFSLMKTVIQLSGAAPYHMPAGEIPWFKYILFRIFSPGNPGIMVTLLAAVSVLVLLFLLIRRRIGARLFEGAIVILCIIELTVPAMGYNPTINKNDILPYPSVFSELQNDGEPFRVAADGSMHLSNYNAVHGLQLMGGYDLPVLKEYADLFLSQNRGNIHSHNWGADSELTDFLNVLFYFSKGGNRPVSSKYELIFDNLNYRVYRNTKAFPRAFMVYDFNVITGKKASLAYLIENDFRLRDTVLLKKFPGVEFKRFPFSSDVRHKVTLPVYQNNSVEVRVETEADGILVLSDIMMPGWEVDLDGVRSEILTANFAFRGVYVPAGIHTVTFKYNPLSYSAGKLMSVSGLLTALFFVLFGVLKNRRRDRSDVT